jgi:hypothetical protein
MNNKQKIILATAILIIAILLIAWSVSGGEIFTKTQVLIEKKDELFGTTYKQWQNKFVWGLDLTGAASAAVAIISGFLIYRFKQKKGINDKSL